MIKCDICRQNGVVTRFRVTGHAGAGEYGQDIVCAGVSAIVYTVLGSLQEMFDIEDFDGVEPDGDGGNVSFRLPSEFWHGDANNATDTVDANSANSADSTDSANSADSANGMERTVRDSERKVSCEDQIRVAAILDAMVIGLKQIEMQYGDYVTVIERVNE